MENLQVIKQQKVLNKEFKVYGTKDEPLFLAKDVCCWLEMDTSNANKLTNNLDDTEWCVTRYNNTNATFITEDGLYEVLMLSRKPIAREFKKQVKAILKEIRKTGSFNSVQASYTIEDPIKRAEKWIEEQKEKLALQENNEVLEIALNESLKYCTVAKYNKMYNKNKWNMAQCKKIGKQISAYCKVRNISIKTCETNDERFGAVNSYPLTVFEDFLRHKQN